MVYDDNLKRIADRFRAFVDEASSHGCPLYAHFSKCITGDSEVLTLAREVRRPPLPNTFFAAVHNLLLRDRTLPLARFYGSLTVHPDNPEASYPAFREFVLAHRQELVPILQTRITQTNEVRRCSYLVPAFQRVFEMGGGAPLSLIDIGCSAGLHLLWDRYHYDYGSVRTGDCASPVQIDCEVRGTMRPPIPSSFPPCVYRAGVDLRPVDLRAAEERGWLEALVFPDHADRRLLLRAAIDVALTHPPETIAGDAIEIFPEMLKRVPAASSLCVYHCHAMCQLSEKAWIAFGDMLLAQSMFREIFWLDAEGYEVNLRHLRNGESRGTKLAYKDGHARWLEWLDS